MLKVIIINLKIKFMSGLNYRVDVDAADASVQTIKEMADKTKVSYSGTVGSIGGFGAIADIYEVAEKLGISKPCTVSGVDGIGTKILIGQAINKLNTLGIDLVAMCVNDVICHGAQPFQFYDYIATGKFSKEQLKQVLEGVVNGCLQAGCELVGGETAELQDMYKPNEWDAAGFTNALVDRGNILPRPEKIVKGGNLIALPSSGIHSNGLTAVRDLIEVFLRMDYSDSAPFDTSISIGDAVLTPTVIYVGVIMDLLQNFAEEICGVANITGGGLYNNTIRFMPDGFKPEFDYDVISDRRSPFFKWLYENCLEQGMTEEDYKKSFNDGIGMVVYCPAEDTDEVLDYLRSEQEVDAFVCGAVV